MNALGMGVRVQVLQRLALGGLAFALPVLSIGGCIGNAQNDATENGIEEAATTQLTVTFRTTVTGNYLGAQNNGGGAVIATATVPQAWETFTLLDINGGTLINGDEVFIRAGSGQFFQAVNGGGSTVNAGSSNQLGWETFRVVKASGSGVVATGDVVGLQAIGTGSWISVQNGGGSSVSAAGAAMLAWEKLTLGIGASAIADAGSPPTTSGNAARQKLLAFFKNIQGNHTVAGVDNKSSSSPSSHTDQIASMTGKKPGFWGGDFGFGSDAVDNRNKATAEAIKQWNAGAVVQFQYHACIPTSDEYCSWDDIGGASPKHLTDAQWTELITLGTSLNAAWLSRLDKLAVFFQQMKAAGVAPLFRPMHEMNQCVFWWSCRKGASGSPKLWQITHDYLVETKGLDNIVWVWNVQDFTSLATDVAAYAPGPDYFDIAALDVYNTGYTSGNYNAMLGAAGGKPIAIGECQFIPSSALLAQQPQWTYFMLWPDFIDEPRNIAAYPDVLNAGNVLTGDEMPGWK